KEGGLKPLAEKDGSQRGEGHESFDAYFPLFNELFPTLAYPEVAPEGNGNDVQGDLDRGAKA
ncbi:hypothetical protein ABTK07_19280, partial [Acinetobacter baumannii]